MIAPMAFNENNFLGRIWAKIATNHAANVDKLHCQDIVEIKRVMWVRLVAGCDNMIDDQNEEK